MLTVDILQKTFTKKILFDFKYRIFKDIDLSGRRESYRSSGKGETPQACREGLVHAP